MGGWLNRCAEVIWRECGVIGARKGIKIVGKDTVYGERRTRVVGKCGEMMKDRMARRSFCQALCL